jgi:hypothetical protein
MARVSARKKLMGGQKKLFKKSGNYNPPDELLLKLCF